MNVGGIMTINVLPPVRDIITSHAFFFFSLHDLFFRLGLQAKNDENDFLRKQAAMKGTEICLTVSLKPIKKNGTQF